MIINKKNLQSVIASRRIASFSALHSHHNKSDFAVVTLFLLSGDTYSSFAGEKRGKVTTPLSLRKWRFCSCDPSPSESLARVMSFSFTSRYHGEITDRAVLASLRWRCNLLSCRVIMRIIIRVPFVACFLFQLLKLRATRHARRRSLNKSIKNAREHTCGGENFNVPFAWRLRLQSKSSLRPCSFFRWCWNRKSKRRWNMCAGVPL